LAWSQTEITFPRDLTPEGEELAPDLGTSPISRGVAFYKGSDTDQRIIYAPGGGHALYCVDALTGKLITSFGENGIVDMHDNLDEVLEHPHDLHISMTSRG